MATNRLIDLSSDTSTRPSPGMRKCMADAEVGDEQKAEDPTTNALQERVAALLGKEAAVFLPSGTMCNQIALLVHCRPGDEIIAADVAHIFTSEAGGGSALAGAQTWPLATKRGIFSGAQVEAALRDTGGHHNPRSRLVAVEQTVNRSGGAVWPLAALEEVGRTAQRHGLAMHMDGARILNAVAASGIPAQRMTAPCDSVWVDLSKGLGLPGRRRAGGIEGHSSPTPGGGSTAWAERSGNPACSLLRGSTPWITMSSGSRKTMPTRDGWRRCSATSRASAS